MRRLALLAALAALAGCGGGSSSEQTLYQGDTWAVVLHGGKAEVRHLVDGKWVVARPRGVRIDILGPQPGSVAPNPPQVAVELHATRSLVQTFLWVDGDRLLEKGGGSRTEFTLYGAPQRLDPGEHTAVGYGRSDAGAAAVAWRFRVR